MRLITSSPIGFGLTCRIDLATMVAGMSSMLDRQQLPFDLRQRLNEALRDFEEGTLHESATALWREQAKRLGDPRLQSAAMALAAAAVLAQQKFPKPCCWQALVDSALRA